MQPFTKRFRPCFIYSQISYTMKKLLIILPIVLSVIVSSCCDHVAPSKETRLSLSSIGDADFVKNINKIYAVGSIPNNPQFNNTQSPGLFSSQSIPLPISYASDSTAYVFEHKNKANDTIVVYYKHMVSYRGGNCGYEEILTEGRKPHYSTLKKYKLVVEFGVSVKSTGLFRESSSPACTIALTRF